MSWIARAVHIPGFPLDREVQVRGAVHILRALEYHHREFAAKFAKIAGFASRTFNLRGWEGAFPSIPSTEQFEILAEMNHEAVAYVNRLGQLHYFAKSVGLVQLLPKTSELIPFRHKYSAHRSVDKPMGESADEQRSQTMAFGWSHAFEGGFPVFGLYSGGKFHRLNILVTRRPNDCFEDRDLNRPTAALGRDPI